MESFAGKLAVVTGAGSGMGRELALQLASDGARLALFDLNADQLEEVGSLCSASPAVSTTTGDVSVEEDVLRFREEVMSAHTTDHAHLLFNNAGIGTTESFLVGDRDAWERTFNVCWNGVYLCSRAFIPLLVAADEGHVINTSSINGFWASVGPSRGHTAYSAAKFAVKGFSEALINEFRLHAPHVKVSLVMPGHVGTEIVANSQQALGRGGTAEVAERSAAFRNAAPTTAETAATIILDGVRAGRWRILVGEDAEILDSMVRSDPERAYEMSFVEEIQAAGILQQLVQ